MSDPRPSRIPVLANLPRLSLPRTAPDGGRDLDLELHFRDRTFHSIGRPAWVLYGALAWAFNRPGRDQ